MQRLEQFALRAAFPLQRVLLQQDFRSLAYSDPMTGLDNFRQFEETLADEMARAERYSRPLSVILLDIDHFKSFNDTLGHQAGDALLGQLGVVLRNSLRNVDKPARYGGEEFVIICPETGADEARLIAERIRRNVADTPFVLPAKRRNRRKKDAARKPRMSQSAWAAPRFPVTPAPPGTWSKRLTWRSTPPKRPAAMLFVSMTRDTMFSPKSPEHPSPNCCLRLEQISTRMGFLKWAECECRVAFVTQRSLL